MAKAVERCAEKGFPYLVYAYWLVDSLGDFKRSNGFQRFDVPRSFVPLTPIGKLALKVGLHRGWRGCSRANWKTTEEAEKTLVPLALAAGERMPLVPG
ncbi:MAG: hypothetical protein DMF44_00010 [Verrucomicrobia bacterium]|nr:MAG: hypothetical protein DMF44_00010 [Verrucomicrobiota bacterium]